ncbi:PREDICTED: uncharacterized protein LOC109164890 [Ipomoea nil]|uniref:uncharacterized protein LOC109164890 n=1 Tax=Ipomoea nil TaxID=35883 RepID=UPI000901BB60|nr:PREDICTED: uncharacterized protein LOC109164890 [Ipomoea nil]
MAKPPESPPTDANEYSPANTLVPFERPVPLLRGPIRTDPKDDPSAGQFTLAFKDPVSWASAYRACENQIIQQCEAGARIGCSVAASQRCQPPWWKFLFGGGASKQEFAERQKCEEREMEGCLSEAKERCSGYAKEKCSRAFLDARIAVKASENPNLNWREASKLISCVNLAEKNLGADLLGPDSANIDDFLKTQFQI